MKPIFALTILLLVGLGLWAGCKSKQTEATVDPAFKSVAAVESDNFLRYDTISPDTKPGTKQVDVQAPTVRILRLPDGFRTGDFRASGRISTSGDNQLVFTTDKKETLALQLDAPERFSSAMKGIKDQTGTIALRYNSSAAEANEQLHLAMAGRMALGYLWQTAAKPLELLDDKRPMLRQLPLEDLPKGNALVDVPVQLLSDSGPITVTPGEEVSFKKGGKNYRAFVHSSIYLAQADAGEDGSSGYVLHAVVVQE
jgi:hypothetical protein